MVLVLQGADPVTEAIDLCLLVELLDGPAGQVRQHLVVEATHSLAANLDTIGCLRKLIGLDGREGVLVLDVAPLRCLCCIPVGVIQDAQRVIGVTNQLTILVHQDVAVSRVATVDLQVLIDPGQVIANVIVGDIGLTGCRDFVAPVHLLGSIQEHLSDTGANVCLEPVRLDKAINDSADQRDARQSLSVRVVCDRLVVIDQLWIPGVLLVARGPDQLRVTFLRSESNSPLHGQLGPGVVLERRINRPGVGLVPGVPGPRFGVQPVVVHHAIVVDVADVLFAEEQADRLRRGEQTTHVA